jgi:hypothetical protein
MWRRIRHFRALDRAQVAVASIRRMNVNEPDRRYSLFTLNVLNVWRLLSAFGRLLSARCNADRRSGLSLIQSWSAALLRRIERDGQEHSRIAQGANRWAL